MNDNLVTFWSEHTAPAYHGVLTGDGWSWDEQRQGYRSNTGSWLVGADLDGVARSFMVSVENQMERETVSLLPNIAEWFPRMNDLSTTMMIVLGFFASGGDGKAGIQPAVDGIESTDAQPGFGTADARMRLRNFADELRGGEAGSARQIVNRAGQYAHAGWMTFQEARRMSHAEARDEYGRKLFLFERNVLDPSCDHCAPTIQTPGCPEVAARGWQLIGTLPRIGLRSCFSMCRCKFAFSLFPSDMAD